jgi:hypothetical protein
MILPGCPLATMRLNLSFVACLQPETLESSSAGWIKPGAYATPGWGPFVSLTREPFTPRPVDGNVESWLGHPEENRYFPDPAHSDFWRAQPEARFFLLRGYDEDSTERAEPGTVFDVTMPIWRVGEVMLYAARLARLFDSGDPLIFTRCRYVGLRGRRLDSVSERRFIRCPGRCEDDAAELATQATIQQVEDNLVEILHQLLTPLYERFAFFELSIDLVRAEIERMTQHRF